MSVRKTIVSLAAISIFTFLSGCGSSSHTATAPPSGGFTDSNFNGTYVFSFAGTDITSSNSADSASFFAAAGALKADGNGNLTGTVDLNDPELAAALSAKTNVFTGVAASGTYKVTSDGRGSGSITVSINGTNVPLGLDFVLASNSGGLITRFDQYGTGSGTLDLQASGIGQSNLVGSYTFGVNGTDSSGNPLGAVGSITLDSSGNATGTEDLNDNGSSKNLVDLALASPSALTVGSGASGTLNLSASAGSLSSLTFDVWVIDATHLKLIETDANAVLAGDAFVSTGQTAFPSGNLVFTMTGGNATTAPLAAGGLLTSSGGAITTGLQDANIGGTIESAPSITGSYSSTGGRTDLSLIGIYNIAGGAIASGTFEFAAYPYNGGVELLEIDSAGAGDGVLSGIAYAQTSTSLAASSGYGLNLTGAYYSSSGSEEVDMIAEFATDSSGGLSGLYDVNNEGTLISDYSLGSGASYANNSNGRGSISIPNLQTNSNNSLVGSLGLTFYTVDSSTAVFIETDASGQITTGTLELQSTPSASSSVARPRVVVTRPLFRPHSAIGKKN
jgi:hypothetical protein